MRENGAKIVIIVLVGLPASGKSSFSDRLKDYLKEKRLGVNLFHISFDKLFKIDEHVIESGHYKMLRGNLLELSRILVKGIQLGEYIEIQNYLKLNHSIDMRDLSGDFDSENHISYVIIDDNNYYRSMRYQFYQLARETYAAFCQIYLGIDVKTAFDRDRDRSSAVGTDIIQKMSMRLEKPNISNTWERRSYFTDIETVDMGQVLSFLEEVSGFPEELCPVKTLTMPQSELHKVDLVLRDAIHRRVKEVASIERAITANVLQDKRKSILQDIKNGLIRITDYNFTDFKDMLYNSDP